MSQGLPYSRWTVWADELKHFVIDLFQTLQARGMPCGEPAEGRFRLPLEEQRALSAICIGDNRI